MKINVKKERKKVKNQSLLRTPLLKTFLWKFNMLMVAFSMRVFVCWTLEYSASVHQFLQTRNHCEHIYMYWTKMGVRTMNKNRFDTFRKNYVFLFTKEGIIFIYSQTVAWLLPSNFQWTFKDFSGQYTFQSRTFG